jgi:hypothetical protein
MIAFLEKIWHISGTLVLFFYTPVQIKASQTPIGWTFSVYIVMIEYHNTRRPP